MKQLLNEWRKFLNEAAEVPKNVERLVQHLASGLPENQRPGFIKSETRKMMLDRDYFQRQYEAYEDEIEESMQMEYYHIEDATYDDGSLAEDVEFWDDVIEEAEYQGRKVTLNKPMRGDVKKSKVYVKDPKTGNVKKVNFGDPNMKIKKSNPERRKSFRARHNCDNPGPKTKARYWSCRAW